MCYLLFFFSSRRRHTRCALVTGVQTCALPICRPAAGPARRRTVYETRRNWKMDGWAEKDWDGITEAGDDLLAVVRELDNAVGGGGEYGRGSCRESAGQDV